MEPKRDLENRIRLYLAALERTVRPEHAGVNVEQVAVRRGRVMDLLQPGPGALFFSASLFSTANLILWILLAVAFISHFHVTVQLTAAAWSLLGPPCPSIYPILPSETLRIP